MRRILILFLLFTSIVSIAPGRVSAQEASAVSGAGDQLETDQWFVGELNGHPAVSLHEDSAFLTTIL